MASLQVDETWVANNNPSQDSNPSDGLFQSGIVNEFLFVFTGKEKGGQSDQKCRL